MHWLRSRSRLVSCLALLSLALQLALSFGHIHLRHVLGEGHTAIDIDDAAVLAVAAERPAQPDHHHAPEHEDEYCAIYAVNGLIASAQVAQPPALPLPAAYHQARPCIRGASQLAATHRGFSRARAPPLVA